MSIWIGCYGLLQKRISKNSIKSLTSGGEISIKNCGAVWQLEQATVISPIFGEDPFNHILAILKFLWYNTLFPDFWCLGVVNLHTTILLTILSRISKLKHAIGCKTSTFFIVCHFLNTWWRMDTTKPKDKWKLYVKFGMWEFSRSLGYIFLGLHLIGGPGL